MSRPSQQPALFQVICNQPNDDTNQKVLAVGMTLGCHQRRSYSPPPRSLHRTAVKAPELQEDNIEVVPVATVPAAVLISLSAAVMHHAVGAELWVGQEKKRYQPVHCPALTGQIAAYLQEVLRVSEKYGMASWLTSLLPR